jgi:glycosyltransferase involved in cell wall biosynthesis
MMDKKLCLVIDASNIKAGGGVTHICELLNASNPKKFGFDKVIIWSCYETLSKLPKKSWLILKSHSFLNRGILFRFLWLFFVKPFVLKKDNCSILFTPGGSEFSNFKPMVTMSQNLLPFDFHEAKRYGYGLTLIRFFLLRILQGYTFKKANGVIFLTKYAYDKVINQIGLLNGTIAIIPHGINDKFFYPPSKKKFFSDNDLKSNVSCKLLYVSVVEVYKHQWNIVDAVYELRKNGYNLTLTLVGSKGSGSKLLNNSIKRLNGDDDWLIIHESQAYEDIQTIYRNADIGIFASSCETYGQIVSESLAASLPLVCSSLSAMKEILGDNAYYFHPEKIDEIKEVILKLLYSSDLRKELAFNGFNIAKKLTWQNTADLTFDFLYQNYQKYSTKNKKHV